MPTGAEVADAWRRAFARQALSDFVVYDLLCAQAGSDECQRLHYLQMALEKTAKVYLVPAMIPLGDELPRTHAVVGKVLPIVFAVVWPNSKKPGKAAKYKGLMRKLRPMLAEIELLAPAVHVAGSRPDNCEYPWVDVDVASADCGVVSPLVHRFDVALSSKDTDMVNFLKVLRFRLGAVAA